MQTILLLGSLASAADCPWTADSAIDARTTRVIVDGVEHRVAGPARSALFKGQLAACVGEAEALEAFQRWRRSRTWMNVTLTGGPWAWGYFGLRAARRKGEFVVALQSALRQAETPVLPGVGVGRVASRKVAPASDLPSIDTRLVTGQRAPGDAAVVIGLEDYAFVADVPYATRDARAFHDLLVYTRGVPVDRVRLLTQGSVEQVRQAVKQAGASVGPGGNVWVYFAGHGAASPVTRERLILGDDVRADPAAFDARAVPLSEIEALAASGGGQPLVVVDACFAGVGRTGEDLAAGARIAVPSWAEPKAGTRIWTAASANELAAPYEETAHGAFTYYAVGALRGWADGELDGVRDGQVTGDEARAYVSRALSGHERVQNPTWRGDARAPLAAGVSETGPDLP